MKPRSGRRPPPVLSTDAGNRLESFLVAAVATVLLVRFYLHLSGYPQLGGHGLHIAHLLWGGLLMLVGLVMTLAYLGRRVNYLASIVGGIGFGLFIDEIGKFVTSDNNYFYQPAVALIYVVFVLLFLAFRSIERRQRLTPTGALANALDLTKDAALHQWTTDEKERALALLQNCDQSDPLVISLRATLAQIPAARSDVSRISRLSTWLNAAYRVFVQARWFRLVVFVVCAVKILTAVAWLFSYIIAVVGGSLSGESSFVDISTAVVAFVEAGLVIIGFREIRQNARLAGYERFKQAMLISVFLGAFLSFYKQQFGGLADLVFDLVILSALQYMIHQERIALMRHEAELQPGEAGVLPGASTADVKAAG